MRKETDFVFGKIDEEIIKLNNTCELIASENYPSKDVLAALGSVLSVKYAEGYPGRRHYAGCDIIDEVETFAIESAKKLFSANFANIQSWSGAQANAAALYAFCNPGDVILSLDLNQGAHLTHGSSFTFSGKYFKHESFDLGPDENIDYEIIKRRLDEVNPRLLIAGTSAYPNKIDFARIREAIDAHNENQEVKTIFMADMAHIAGLVAAGLHMSPVPYADVVTSTSHKTLRGPRGGFILWNNEEFTKKINQAVFPGIQGGPNAAAIAAKGICFNEAMTPEFKKYAVDVCLNMKAMLEGIRESAPAIRFVAGGSETHLGLLDLKPIGINGADAEKLLEALNIICNKNMIAGDPFPSKSTGIRIGSPAMTTRGLDAVEFKELGNIIGMRLVGNGDELGLKNRVIEILKKHPIY